MQKDGGGNSPAAPAKRTRRPSVRLHQPYYENPGHRRVQRQWTAIEKVAKKPRTSKAEKKGDGGGGGESDHKGERMEGFDSDDHVAIGNWKSFGGGSKRGRSVEAERIGKKRVVSIRKGFEGNEEEIGLSSGGDGANRDSGTGDSDQNVKSIGDDDENVKSSDGSGKNDGDLGVKERTREEGVRVWLKKLGLEKYVPLFGFHGVDDEVLPLLTLDDLKDMGIKSVGPRRKMYAAIRKLGKGFP